MAKQSKSQKKYSKLNKFLSWWDKYGLKTGAIFLLILIPLLPKVPLCTADQGAWCVIDIVNSWVHIRIEDFIVGFLALLFVIETIRRKTNIKSPLTLPILLYWGIGLVTVMHSLVFLVPTISNLFSHLIVLHYLRRIEYMILFFIVLTTIRSKKDINHYLTALIVTLTGVTVYGWGQKFFQFPAFLTMNEEFSKGEPLFLPSGARIASTFAGHYDLAAFLVLTLPIVLGLFFAVRNLWIRAYLAVLYFGAYILLLFTASRVSFAAYLGVMTLALWFLKKRWWIIPMIIVSIVIMQRVDVIASRFDKTVRTSQIVVDAQTGEAISTLEDFKARPTPTPKSGGIGLIKPKPTPYEELPLGSEFLEIPFEKTRLLTASESAHLAAANGQFLIKDALVFEISFTTRLQGGWPRAIEAFQRNPFIGSGFSAASLATDNDYLRMLGETGIIGMLSFLSIFFVFFLIARQFIRKVDDAVPRSFMIGMLAGVVGLFVNAVLIDVFEASKVAYILWILLGAATGMYMILLKKKESLVKEAQVVITHPITAFIILSIVASLVLFPSLNSYFSGDDFTWIRWSADRTNPINPLSYFTDAEGFFYRPLTKLFFYYAYPFPLFGMKPWSYHAVSYGIHLFASFGAFMLIRSLTKRWSAGIIAGSLFLIHPIHAENVLWVSGYSSLWSGAAIIGSLFLLRLFDSTKYKIKWLWYVLSLVFAMIATYSYEVALAYPFVVLSYLVLFMLFDNNWKFSLVSIKRVIPLWIPYLVITGIYLYMRNAAAAHGISGDYGVNISKLFYNTVGNLVGYIGMATAGFSAISYYDTLRTTFAQDPSKMIPWLVLVFVIVIVSVGVVVRRKIIVSKAVVFLCLLFVISLIPALGLGNATERYLYVGSLGIIGLISYVLSVMFEKGYIAKTIAALIALLLMLFYVHQFRAAQQSWVDAGEVAKRILTALPTNYKKFPKNSTLFFIDLPLRNNRAWIFPVGLEDGVWMIYEDDTLIFEKGNEIQEGLDYAEVNKNTYIFLYENGGLQEIKMIKTAEEL